MMTTPTPRRRNGRGNYYHGQQQRSTNTVSSLSSLFWILVTSFLLFLSFFDGTSSPSPFAYGMAPPNFQQWEESGERYEDVHSYRKRIGTYDAYNYTPAYITHEHCHFMTPEQCRREDEIFERAHKKRRDKIRDRRLTPVNGEYNILVLLVYFPEHADLVRDGLVPPKEYFETMLNGADGDEEINPGGSMKEWLQYQSLDQYHVNFIIQDYDVAAESEAFYAAGNRGQNGLEAMQKVFTSKLSKLDSEGFDWTVYDQDGDGELDNVVVFHTGIPAEQGPQECGPSDLDRIWSQAANGAIIPGGWVASDGRTRLAGFTLSSVFGLRFCDKDDRTVRVYTPTGMAIFAHEYGHTYGLPDLYDFDYQEPKLGPGGVGAFDVMSYAYGMKSDNKLPAYLSAYCRILAGFLEPIPITQNGFYHIMPAEISRQVYIIDDPYPDGEFLLIENRMKFKWSEDWDGEGIVIYHVDENAPLQSERGYPGHPNWPREHYRVQVLQKDGKWDIEQMVNVGDAGDFYVKGDEIGNCRGDPNNWPCTDAISGGTMQATGITIRITTDPGYFMEFEVSGLR